MRLVCPNCGAQYEVDDSVVPDGGRDVQCSSCGHTWFQKPAHKDKDLADELGHDESEIETDEDVQIETDSDVDETVEHHEEAADADSSNAEEPTSSEPQRRGLDEGVTDILREEAELETHHRVDEGSSLETQQELGLSGDADDGAGVKERMARLRGMGDEDLGAAAAAAALGGARKDLLPDVEEINSTLTASSEREGEETAEEFQEKRKRSGFRRGFTLTLFLFALLAIAYAFAPKIAEMVPAAEPFLAKFVDWVNALRTTVDNGMLVAIEKLTTLLAQLTGSGDAT